MPEPCMKNATQMTPKLPPIKMKKINTVVVKIEWIFTPKIGFNIE